MYNIYIKLRIIIYNALFSLVKLRIIIYNALFSLVKLRIIFYNALFSLVKLRIINIYYLKKIINHHFAHNNCSLIQVPQMQQMQQQAYHMMNYMMNYMNKHMFDLMELELVNHRRFVQHVLVLL